ncbi:MAG: hypothetical protein K0U24_03945 [Gammaproteobacteria bacterium]|nr:hypothetical protein [Gammaproteobacteria bacterium]MCH9763368.1 hypothetical protein [Gammaproteobacteria bacterium]
MPLFLSVDATNFVTKIGETQSVNLINTIGNTYVPNKHWEDKTSVLFGVGATTYQNNNMIFNTGLRYLNMSNMLSNGNVWQLNTEDY